MAKKRIFISDVHLGSGRFSTESQNAQSYPHDWGTEQGNILNINYSIQTVNN